MQMADYEYLETLSLKIRNHCVDMAHTGKCSHLGSSLSCVEVLTFLYFSDFLTIDPKNPVQENRDRVIISKGHAAAVVYSVLAEKGFFPLEELQTFYQNNTRLAGHVSHFVPGIEASTGSLGHGLSIASGIAFAAKRDNKNYKICCICSDGECNEGSTWEAAMFAGFHKLSNLLLIIDKNKIQALGHTKDVLSMEPFTEKWRNFGWHVEEIDGHSFKEIEIALENFKSENNKPTCIIANTIKGKGVSFMEDQLLWHYRTPQGNEYEAAKKELEPIV
jgi:transketolase